MILALVAAAVLVRHFSFYDQGPYDPAIPRPETILGFGPGRRHSTYRDQERVVLAIAAAAPDRVRTFEYGKSTEGRPLRVFAVSSPSNIRRLAEIQAQHAKLAQGKGSSSATIPIVWINECIHGDETASFEAAMWTLYNLAASRGSLSKALDKEVVILNPVYNPDGHERYVVYYNSIAVGSPEPDAYEHRAPQVMLGRLNHYRFDMNRDRVAFSQQETREEFAEMLRWNPQAYIDQHGQVGSYFFPPEPMSINANVDRARNAKWTETFGRAIGRAFDAQGMSYFVRDEFDLFYPGYIDSSNTLTGAIGMTHETDGGRVLSELREDGSTVTLQQGMAKHFTSALAIVKAAADNAQDLLADYAKFKRQACSGESAGAFQRVILTGDPRALRRLQTQLSYAGIESGFAPKSWIQPDSHDYWSDSVKSETMPAGSLVIDVAQPQGALAKALLEPKPEFEPDFIKEQNAKKPNEEPDFYDLTGWSIPYAHDLHAWWSSQRAPVETAPPKNSTHPAPYSGAAAYAIPYRDDEDALCVFEALDKGVRGMISTKPMTLQGRNFPEGTFLFLAGRNEDGYQKTLENAAAEHGSELVPLTSTFPDAEERYGPGSESVLELRKPKIALVMGNPGTLTECGGVWYLLERVWKLPFTPITNSALSDGDLSRFTCILLPEGTSVPSSGRFREWLNEGGVAISLSGDPGGFADLGEPADDAKSLPGALFRAEMDPRSFLSYGYDRSPSGLIDIAVPREGKEFHDVKKAGGSVISFPKDEKRPFLLSGWEWPDDTEKHLKGTLVVQDAPVGRGHMIIYEQDPTDRAMWPGLYKTLLNAMLIR